MIGKSEVELREDRVLGVGRELRAREVHLLADLLQRLVHVHAVVELGGDARVALDGGGGQLLDVRDLVELLLDDARDQRLHVVRRDARVDGADVDHRDQ
jgi:hypothetical protein